jgi:hypothetical protein
MDSIKDDTTPKMNDIQKANSSSNWPWIWNMAKIELIIDALSH